MIQAVIFDLYGVLALNGWQAFKAKHFSDREDVWDEVFQIGRRVDAGLADYGELIRFTAEQSGETEQTVRYQMEHTMANDALLEFVAERLRPRYKLGILSNASDPRVMDDVFTEQQQALFDSATFSHHVGQVKPHASMYETAASRLGLEAGECLFVDDQERHALGARDAGMQALVYQDLNQFKREIEQIVA